MGPTTVLRKEVGMYCTMGTKASEDMAAHDSAALPRPWRWQAHIVAVVSSAYRQQPHAVVGVLGRKKGDHRQDPGRPVA